MVTKKLIQFALAVGVAAAASGCAMAGPGLVTGGIYTGYKHGAGAGPAKSGAKTGEACAMSILGIVALGDASVETAKKEGGISTVATVDNQQFGILGIYANTCTVVKGE